MTAIVAADQNWGIGYQNRLLFRIKEDQRFFRETTEGGVVVMGRKTFQSLPKQKPLKNRINIVLSKDPAFHPEGAFVVNGEETLFEKLSAYKKESVFLIGGEQVYKAFLSECDLALVTRVEAIKEADAYFPDLDRDSAWALTERSEQKEEEGIYFTFCRYERKNQ